MAKSIFVPAANGCAQSKFKSAKSKLLTSTAVGMAVVLAVASPGAHAAALVWSGATNSVWATGTNWVGGTAPVAADTVTVGGSGTQPNVNAASTVAGTSVTGGTLTVSSNLTSPTVGVSAVGILTITAAGTVTGNVSHSSSALTSSNAGTITGTLDVSAGAFANAGSVGGITTVSGGTLNLNAGTNLSNTSALNISGGVVNVNASDTVGPTNVSGGSLFVGDGAGTDVLTSNVTTTGTGIVQINATGQVAGNVAQGSSGTSANFGAAGGTGITGTLTVSAGTFNNAGNVGGATTVSGGILNLNAGSNLADAAALVVNSPGTVNVNAAETVGSLAGSGNVALNANLTAGGDNSSTTYSGVLSGASSLTKEGTGTMTVSGNNTYAGLTNINQGALRITSNNALGLTGAGTVVASGAALEVAGGITSAEPIILNGTGISNGGALRNISGNNVLSGNITLGSPAVRINADAGKLDITGPILGVQNLTLGGAGTIAVVGPIQTGASTLTKDGTGLVTLFGANTFTGSTTVNNGTLQTTGGASLSDTAALNINSPGIVQFFANETVGGLSGNGTATLVNSSILTVNTAPGSTTFSGAIGQSGTGTGALVKSGANTLTLSGANTYTGTTTVNGGILDVTGSIASLSNIVNSGGSLRVNGSSLLDTADVTLNGTGNLDVAAGTETIGSLNSTSTTSTVTLNSNNLYVGSGEFAGVISGDGLSDLRKVGPGSLELTGVNTFTGQTNVEQGTLYVTGAGSLASNADVTTQSGATFETDGGALASTVDVFNNGIFRVVGTENVGFLDNVDGTIDLQDGTASNSLINVADDYTGGGTLQVDAFLGGPGSTSDRLVISGDILGDPTSIEVNDTNAGPAAYNPTGIEVVTAQNALASDMTLAGGPIDKGLFFYDLAFFNNGGPGGSDQFRLVGLPDAEVFEVGTLAEALGNVWNEAANGWGTRQTALRDDLQCIQAVADAPDAPAACNNGLGAVWVAAMGNWRNTDATNSISAGSLTYTFDTGFDQRTWGLMGGADFGHDLSGGGNLLFGFMGGYLNSDLDFDASASTIDMEGFTTGVYLGFVNGGYFAKSDLIGTFMDADYAGGGMTGNGDANTLGVRTDMGYRLGSNAGFVEGLVSSSFSWSDIDDINVGGNVVSLDGSSKRVGAGLRAGVSNGTFSASLTGRVWNEFGGHSVSVSGFSYSAGTDGLIGEVSGQVSAALGSNANLFLNGGAEFADDTQAYRAEAGVSITF